MTWDGTDKPVRCAGCPRIVEATEALWCGNSPYCINCEDLYEAAVAEKESVTPAIEQIGETVEVT